MTNPYAPPVDTGGEVPSQTVDKRTFLDASGRAKAAVAFLGIGAGVQLLRLVGDLYALGNLEAIAAVMSGKAEPTLGVALYGMLTLLTGLLWLIALIGSAIAFCMWFYRVYGNLLALGTLSLRYQQGMAPGSFFIPILCLFYPYRIANEIWHGSTPKDTSRWTSSPVGLWWLTWIFGGGLGFIADKMAETPGSGGLVLDISAAMVMGVAAVYAIKLIRGVQWRQAARRKELSEEGGL